MTLNKAGRTLLGLALVFAATACDDNPLAEDRDEAAYFRLNPSNTAVNVGGTVKVNAVVVNKFGAATNASVTATACDAKVSAVADTGRTAYEFPERFVVTGVSLGTSCIVVRGGGITDTVTIRVIPAAINVAGLDTVRSGETAAGQLQFLNAAGQPVQGFTLADVTFTNLTAAQGVVDAEGNVTGQAPGTGRFVVSLKPTWGATRVDTVTYVVKAGNFTGTTAQAAYQGGQAITFNAGAIAFDADTQIQFTAGSMSWTSNGNSTSATSRQFMLPYGLAAGTPVSFSIVNLGPNQVASVGTFTTTTATPASDPAEPDESTGTPKVIVAGETIFGTVQGQGGVTQASGPDVDDLIKIVVTTAGAHTVTLSWDDGSDIDLYVLNSSLSSALLARETLANPETGSVTLAVGTYYINPYIWEAATNNPIRYTLRVTR